jgi:hypothetical protein
VVEQRIGRWATITPIDDTHCHARLTADMLDWPAFAMGVVGADFRVLGPPEFADQVKVWSKRFAKATR